MRNKILVVDDEKSILQMIKLYLESENFEVYTAQNTDAAKNLLNKSMDLIILDVNMPDMNGFDFCIYIRQHVNCPIIFLSARVSPQDHIQGLKVGGDDYLNKPFDMEELVERVRAHIRRENRTQAKTDVKFGDNLIIDYSRHLVFWENEVIDVSNKEFEIISILSQNPGIVFDRETIYERLWGYDAEGDSNVVKEHVRKIRNKIHRYTNEQIIETVWGVGYRWKK